MPLASRRASTSRTRRHGGVRSISPPFQGTTNPPVASRAVCDTISSSMRATSS